MLLPPVFARPRCVTANQTMDRLLASWTYLSALDAALAQLCNRASRPALARALFAAISRLGDGMAWYLTMAALPLAYGWAGVDTAWRMVLAGALGVTLYKWLKTRIARPRPFRVHPGVTARVAPLDAFSFPSGHTLHAVSFAAIVAARHPGLAGPLGLFALLVAASRPILGLHYPSDVLAGALIGAALAQLILVL